MRGALLHCSLAVLLLATCICGYVPDESACKDECAGGRNGDLVCTKIGVALPSCLARCQGLTVARLGPCHGEWLGSMVRGSGSGERGARCGGPHCGARLRWAPST